MSHWFATCESGPANGGGKGYSPIWFRPLANWASQMLPKMDNFEKVEEQHPTILEAEKSFSEFKFLHPSNLKRLS